MILVKIELHSAITGEVTEIGRMKICNDRTSKVACRGNYKAELMRRGTAEKVHKRAEVKDWPRLSYSVWKLLRKCLEELGV